MLYHTVLLGKKKCGWVSTSSSTLIFQQQLLLLLLAVLILFLVRIHPVFDSVPAIVVPVAQAFSNNPLNAATRCRRKRNTTGSITFRINNNKNSIISSKLRLLPEKQTSDTDSRSLCASDGLRRRSIFASLIAACSSSILSPAVQAAPPIAVIAEELGYYPIVVNNNNKKNQKNVYYYAPKPIQRRSSPQAIELANHIVQTRSSSSSKQAKYQSKTTTTQVFVAYWCPYCQYQRELWGREAWTILVQGGGGGGEVAQPVVVECGKQGYRSQPSLCIQNHVEGYPTWKFGTNDYMAGVQPLSVVSQRVGFGTFDPSLETDLPNMPGSSNCKLRRSTGEE